MGLMDGAGGEMKKGVEKMNEGWRENGQKTTQAEGKSLLSDTFSHHQVGR